ncbi:MAG: hypothetical protein AB8B64_05310 [Granulosicoccus sp.]
MKLLSQSGQKTILSDDGQRLTGYARQILRLNNEAVAHYCPLSGLALSRAYDIGVDERGASVEYRVLSTLFC